MLTRIRHQVVCPWIRRPRGVAFAIALIAALSSSSAFAQCRGGSGGSGAGMAGGGAGGGGGMGLSSIGIGASNGAFAAGGRGQNGAGFFSVPSEQMFQPAFAHVVDDNYQYVAARRAARAARAEQARQRLAFRTERPTNRRTVAANVSGR